jgi:hypothetical protein
VLGGDGDKGSSAGAGSEGPRLPAALEPADSLGPGEASSHGGGSKRGARPKRKKRRIALPPDLALAVKVARESGLGGGVLQAAIDNQDKDKA